MTTISEKNCNEKECGYPLLELVACKSCGNMMIEGETDGTKKVRQKASVGYEAFSIEEDDAEEDNFAVKRINLIRFVKNSSINNFKSRDLIPQEIDQAGLLIDGDTFLQASGLHCPYCDEIHEDSIHFRISSAFANRVLADVILEQTQPNPKRSGKALYEGRNYISFTDSRQGTAKISALINIDSEASWTRYQIYHQLLSKLPKQNHTVNTAQLIEERAYYVQQLDMAPPFAKRDLGKKIETLNQQLSGNAFVDLKQTQTRWIEVLDSMRLQIEFKLLFEKISKGDNIVNEGIWYGKGLLYDQMARRLQRDRSLENLGLVNLVFPVLEDVALPIEASTLGISLDEWKTLLKIAADYIIRYGFHFSYEMELLRFTTRFYRQSSIDLISWPQFNRGSIVQPRLVLLLCAGLGWHDKADISRTQEDELNDLLKKIWETLKSRLLRADKDGFLLDLFDKSVFELAGKQWLCPVHHRLVDKIFRSYSPWIKGSLTTQI